MNSAAHNTAMIISDGRLTLYPLVTCAKNRTPNGKQATKNLDIIPIFSLCD